MTTRIKILSVILVAVTAFAVGRYSNRGETIKTDTRTNTQTQINQHKNIKTHTVVVTIKNPNGTTTSTATTDTTIADQITDDTNQQTDTKTEKIPAKTGILRVNVLAGVDLNKGMGYYDYGVSISKEVFGPVTVGVWGLNNKSAGVSVGLDF